MRSDTRAAGGGLATSRAIEVTNLTKVYGDTRAVDDPSFSIEPGTITGFLGPNGAGKTTPFKMLVGLAAPTSGTAQVFGRPYGGLRDPVGAVGSVLEVSSYHPGRSARNHLRLIARTAGLPAERSAANTLSWGPARRIVVFVLYLSVVVSAGIVSTLKRDVA